MSRLRKKYAMDMNAFQSTINQTSQKGREILKSLEDFKFTLEQTARLLNNNQKLSQGMIQKRKSIDEISTKLYQIVFDMENMDISNAFMTQNQPVMEEVPNKPPVGKQQPGTSEKPQLPGQPIQPGTPAPGKDKEDEGGKSETDEKFNSEEDKDNTESDESDEIEE